MSASDTQRPLLPIAALGMLAAPALFFAVFAWIDRPATGVQSYEVARADALASDALTPPGPGAGWQRDVPLSPSLPVDPGRSASVWYRVSLAGRGLAGQDGLAVYLPSPLANVAVFLGEQALGDSGPMQEPLPYVQQPLWFRFHLENAAEPPPLHLHVARVAPRSSIPAFYVGPVDALRPAFERDLLLKRQLPWVIVAFMASLAVIVGSIWGFRRQESAYGWFALFILLWCFYTGHALIDRPPVDHWLWWSLSYLALWFTLVGAIFVNRFFGFEARRIERTFLGAGVVGSVLVLVGGVVESQDLRNGLWLFAWLPMNTVVACYGLVQWLRGTLRRPTADTLGMLVCFALVVAVSVRDILFLMTESMPGSMLYLRYTAPITLGVFALSLMRRFARSLSQTEDLAQTLERRVEQKSQELASHYERLRELEAHRAVSQERERIMRDVHDGLGGQLVQVLSLTAQQAELAPVDHMVRRALGDLRLIVDSMLPSEGDLVAVLAAFRHRIGAAVEAQGLAFHWQVGDVPRQRDLGPERVLQILRILEEAVSNVLRHSGAQTLSIATDLAPASEGDERSVRIEVADDGAGFDPAGCSAGQGLRNMSRRAEQLGARLDVTSDASGTRVLLTLPAGTPR